MPQEFSRLARLFTAVAGFAVLAACGGGGGGGNNGGIGGTPSPPPGGTTNVTFSGKITFDRLQFQPIVGTGLNATSPVVSPAREVIVEAVSNGAVVATASTDSNGDYSVSVPANATLFIRARAQMVKTGAAPTWNFTVRDNSNSDAVYVLQGDSFNTGTTNGTRNLHAPSGWVGNGYDDTQRFAGPFAILDTVYRTKQLILSASPTAALPQLDLYWSVDNRTALFCPDDDGNGTSDCLEDNDPNNDITFCPDDGNIGTSFYFRDPSGSSTDDCRSPEPLPEGIYILGDYASGNGDTDEFDSHVIAHEFGHYFEDRFSRSDSIGGEHSFGDRLDLRVAFGEGWGNAFGAMALGDPEYRDSSAGISQDGGFNLETGTTLNEGWFSEASVGEFLWDVFDDNATVPESGDNVPLGFAPIFAVMTDEQVDTDAFTSIYSFASALQGNNAGSSGAIDDLLDREEIQGSGAFGTGESNDDDNVFGVLPVYQPVALGGGGQAYVCNVLISENVESDLNKLGNSRFLSFENDAARAVVITVQGATTDPSQDAAADPDVFVYRRGQQVAFGNSGGSNVPPATRRVETVSTSLEAGTYVIEVYDFELSAAGSRPRCMTVSIAG